jgi:isopenicillin N synthase-like dioxygenase
MEGRQLGEIPIIDIAGLRSGDPARRRAVAGELGSACRDTGFFYAQNHGVAPSLVAAAFAGAKAFFALPMAEKLALDLKRTPNNVGYGELHSEQLDPTAPADLNESFNIGLELPADDPEILAGIPFRGVNFWPPIAGWRDTMLDYFNASWAVGRLLHRGFCLDLGLDEDFFEDKLDAPMAVLRLLRYPARTGSEAARQFGAGEHTDYGNLTLLATDGVAGLQLRDRAGSWVAAPSIPGTFICNIGDCLMRWTNDIYVSTPHRVLPPTQERYSIPFFLDPNPDARVETIPGFGPSKYPPTTGARYLKERFDATYAHRAALAS